MQTKILPWLDLLRYVAALLVVIGHCRSDLFVNFNYLPSSQQTLGMQVLYVLTSLGHSSVLIFFVLSGYLVGGGVLLKLSSHKFNCLDYTIDRACRIQLPLLAALILIFISNLITGTSVSFTEYILNFFSLQGVFCPPLIGPLWSLSYEVWFYIIAGATASLLSLHSPSKRINASLILVISMFILSRLYVIYTFLWMMGALASRLSIKFNIKYLVLAFVVMVISAVSSLHAIASKLDITPGSLFDCALTLIFGAASCLFIIQIVQAHPKNVISKALNKFGYKFAKFSYTLYLTHTTVMSLFLYFGLSKSDRWDMSSWVSFITVIVVSHIVAYILYLPFEKQSYRLKKWIKSRICNRESSSTLSLADS